MIDKRIFYCWFGHGEMSELNKKCIASWKRFCPDYEIIEINESNYDINERPHIKEAYEKGNWAYVSDDARLKFLKDNNGFYIDTDIQLTKSLNEMRIFDGGFITEFDTGQPDSGILGRGSVFPELYKKVYEEFTFGTMIHKGFIKHMYEMYDVHSESIKMFKDGFTILGEEYFPSIQTGIYTENTIGIHFFENTWTKNQMAVTDDFYPYPRVIVKTPNKVIHADPNPEVIMKLKHISKKWTQPDMIGRMEYFFNPKVVKLSCPYFEAERIDYNKLQTQRTTVTPSNMIVTWLD